MIKCPQHVPNHFQNLINSSVLHNPHTHTGACVHAHTHTHTQPFYGPLGFCTGLPRWAGTRKVKPGR